MINNDVWKNLQQHFTDITPLNLQNLFAQNKNRFEKFSCQGPEIFLDYSKNLVTEKTFNLLVKLAKSANLQNEIDAMFSGKPINTTEERAVLHTALRNRSDVPVYVAGEDIMPKVKAVLKKVELFSCKVRNGEWRGYTGKKIAAVVNIGIGGSDLGPKMVCYALQHYAANNLHCYFVSNIDGSQITETLKTLNPETTLFIVASKTFTTQETLTNANTAKDWLLKKLGDNKAVAKHFVAVSTNEYKVKEFGIDPENMFEFWDWVGGRYSVWSAIGLTVALTVGIDNFEKFLGGVHEMDQHFRQTGFEKNLPVILALLGIWYRDFFDFSSYAIVPYNYYLQYFTAYLQQLDMESNGKSVKKDSTPVNYQTGPVIWGGIGTDCQHSFHQLLHQGTSIIPVDFIISRKSLNPTGEHHKLLFANCLAQSQALLQGKNYNEAYQELIDKGLSPAKAKALAPHKVMSGNRPSNTLLIEKLTPRSLGALIALYEHKVFTQGVIWKINSFDQWGVELGKQLTAKIGSALENKKNTNQYDSSTEGLIAKYL